MIPSYFVRLEKMPLTTNGKINRKALPKPGMNRREIFTAPRNELEKKLIDLWAEILGKEDKSFGIDDNFFQLGGHSLKATVLLSRLQKELNVVTALSEIFKAPTVRTLAEYIKKTKSIIPKDMNPQNIKPQNMNQNLVLLKEGLKENNHLFFIHDGRGEIEAYLELCKHLPLDFNYWGIRIDSAENVTIRELAQIHIHSLKKIQSHGPYHIAGWSLGGTIAFEIALQLEQSGEKIAFLALIDTPPPHKNLMKEIEFNNQLMGYSNLSKQLLVARALYKPVGKINAPVHYIAARQSKKLKKENWQKYSSQKITYEEVPGDHFSILKSSQVLQLALLFSRLMNQNIFLKKLNL
jgi:thioesterase domain-containing protein/acyl carrier protein